MNLLKHHKIKISKRFQLMLIISITSLFTLPLISIASVQTNSQATSNRVQTGVLKTQTLTSSTNAFISIWNTSKTSSGSSNSTQIKLPLVSSAQGGNYNFNVNWGDGNTSVITGALQAVHNYGKSGVYVINITGTIQGWRFNNNGDRLKLLEITQWGPLNLGNLNFATGSYFSGASNLDVNATDALKLAGTYDLSNAFSNCTNLGSSGTGDFNS